MEREYGDGKSIIEILNIGFEPLLTEKEYKIYKEMGLLKYKIYNSEKTLSFVNSKLMYLDEEECYYKWLYKEKKCIDVKIKRYNKLIKYKRDLFKKILNKNIKRQRKIFDNRKFNNIDQFRNIAIFESDLTRTFCCKDMEHSDDIISVVTYYTEIFDNIIHNGFIYKDIKYIFFTAGAGQTRNKKSTFVNEKKLYENYNKLFCGLSKQTINDLGGMNTNKYLAYTSLCQTNSSIWKSFNIDKAIVVEDIEYNIPNQKVRYIYTETPQDKLEVLELDNQIDEITRQLRTIKYLESVDNNDKLRNKKKKELIQRRKDLNNKIHMIKDKYHKISINNMDVTIPFTDGFGIMFKKDNTAMIRLPFMKGLMSYVSKSKYKQYCQKNSMKINKIVDIYGKEWSIDEVDYIFTKSQFKMNKYFNNILDSDGNILKYGWDIYKDNFKKYNCDACRCNIEGRVKLNAKTNYQILQTLTTEMTDKDIKELASYDIDNLNGIGNNIQSMLNILGADKSRTENLNWLQKSLILYPEMLKDFYVKTLLKNTKESMVKKFKSGKFNINGAYIFIIPDPLACLEWWFNGERDLNKLGLLKEGEVYCRLFKDKEEVDCLRSPHLDHAHCIRKNVRNKDIESWYKTNGLYIGVKDIMSKLLMFDNDGDKSLVHNNKTIIKCAKSYQEKYGMIPNYYEMPKANPQELNNTTLFEGIVMAYHHGNIGAPSNEITKVFDTLNINSTKEDVEEAIEIVALRCADVNYTIDYAKTLYKPEVPKHILQKYKKYSKRKVPKFFIYAKDKRLRQVEDITDSNINRISSIVKSKRIVFKNLLGKYSYKIMTSENVDIKTDKAQEIINLYKDVDNTNRRQLSNMNISMITYDKKKKYYLLMEYNSAKQKQLFVEMINEPIEYIVNVLVKGLLDDINKDTLWRLFGEEIYNNIYNNLKDTKICEMCGERFKYHQTVGRPKLICNKCSKEKELKNTRLRVQKYRKK